MRDHATPSADRLEEAASLPIDDNLRPALALLRHAYDCARDAHAAAWDFALEIGELYEAGLTITDLRWLVVKGFVEHGGETSAYGDKHRSFTRSDGFNFLTTTCVVLTKKGAALACQISQASAATQAASDPRAGGEQAAAGSQILAANGETRTQASLKPRWDPARRELSLGGGMVKRFRVPAKHHELILAVFQEEGWPEGIDDPLPGDRDLDPRTRLNDVAYRLNRSQIEHLIHFHTNGGGSVHWSLCDRQTRR